MYIRHTHPTGTTPEAREETLRLLYQSCLRELQGQDGHGSGLPRRPPAQQASLRRP